MKLIILLITISLNVFADVEPKFCSWNYTCPQAALGVTSSGGVDQNSPQVSFKLSHQSTAIHTLYGGGDGGSLFVCEYTYQASGPCSRFLDEMSPVEKTCVGLAIDTQQQIQSANLNIEVDGYLDLKNGSPQTFYQSISVPIPSNAQIGPSNCTVTGDTLRCTYDCSDKETPTDFELGR